MYEWDKQSSGSGAEELRAVIQVSDGGLLLAGKSASGVSGDRTQPSQGGTNFWLVKVAPDIKPLIATREAKKTAVLVNEMRFSVLTAYPNPIKEQVTVSFTLPETQNITRSVYDSQDRTITTLYQGEAKANETLRTNWVVNNKASGIYLLQLQTPTQGHQQELLVTR